MMSSRSVRILLDRLCVKMGFCLSPVDIERILNDPPTDVRAFTDEVFRSEGLDPTTADRHLYRSVRAMVADAFAEEE